MNLTYNKALVPTIVGIMMLVLTQFGINETMTVGEMVSFVVTSALVYFVPNKTA